MIRTVQLNYRQCSTGCGIFLRGQKQILGVQAELGAVNIFQLQNGYQCWFRRLKIALNDIWVLLKPFFLEIRSLEQHLNLFGGSQIYISFFLKQYRLLRLQNVMRCCLRDLFFCARFMQYPNILL